MQFKRAGQVQLDLEARPTSPLNPTLYTADGIQVPLKDMYRGRPAFLICSGPSLTTHNLALLQERGILTLAVNNAATVVRPNLWTCVDDPGNFCDVIWRDPGIMKFVPQPHMKKHFLVRDEHDNLVRSEECVGDMPAVFGYQRNEEFNAERWLYEETFNWGNHSRMRDSEGNKGSRSVMYIALRLLFYLGVRTTNLVGCDFRMEVGKANYAFPQDRTHSSVRNNNSSYRILNARLERLKPYFEQAGYRIFNCTPDSGLSVFPYRTFDDAVARAAAQIPTRINTTGMYDRKARERTENAVETRSPRPIPAFTLITAVDAGSARILQHTWPTWMQQKPILREVPVLVIHDQEFDPNCDQLDCLREHSNLRFIPWKMPVPRDQGEPTLSFFVDVPSHNVTTPWYLRLDANAIAIDASPWPYVEWFDAGPNGRLPSYISNPWGYSRPADVIKRLDDWGDRVPQLSQRPRLGLPSDPQDNLVRHPGINSWLFFGNTRWTKEISSLVVQDPPFPSHDILMYYCAARRGDFTRRIQMKDHGWDHISHGFRRLRRRCLQALH